MSDLKMRDQNGKQWEAVALRSVFDGEHYLENGQIHRWLGLNLRDVIFTIMEAIVPVRHTWPDGPDGVVFVEPGGTVPAGFTGYAWSLDESRLVVVFGAHDAHEDWMVLRPLGCVGEVEA